MKSEVNFKIARKFGDARDNPDYGKPRSTMPPRHREGKIYPGGRHMRRTLKNKKKIEA